MDAGTTLANVKEIADRFAAHRKERQRRRSLDPDDFEALGEAGFLMTGVPREEGGLWAGVAGSVRVLSDLLRTLGRGDPSVALVSSMHPAVTSFWLATQEVSGDHAQAWARQRRDVWQSAVDGCWWGTIVSEPGSGGDIAKTRSRAAAVDDSADDGPGYRLTGQKHFGSGSGISSFMMTTAVPDDDEPDLFFMDVRDVPWDGSRGIELLAEWDGHGMAATQSHAMAFEDYPVTRSAWPGHLEDLAAATGGLIPCLFTSVIAGVVDSAYVEAAARVEKRRAGFRAFEQVEWARVEMEVWTVAQALEGAVRALESGAADAPRQALLAKTVVAEHAESALRRICKVVGGSSFSRHSPYGYWFQDVRALGFLRPPWGLAFETLFEAS